MDILCDQNVARQYIEAFEQSDEITVTTVASELSADASDAEIARFAATHNLVVFTSDDDFFDSSRSFGLLVYNQIEAPKPGDVISAVLAIERAYESRQDIVETVPGNWTDLY